MKGREGASFGDKSAPLKDRPMIYETCPEATATLIRVEISGRDLGAGLRRGGSQNVACHGAHGLRNRSRQR